MVTARQQEQAHLAQSDKHIAACEHHIAEQEARIARLRADGHDTAAFEDVLATLLDTLAQHRAHRATILRQIALYESDPLKRGQTMKGDGAGTETP